MIFWIKFVVKGYFQSKTEKSHVWMWSWWLLSILFFCKGADKHNSILMSILFLVVETFTRWKCWKPVHNNLNYIQTLVSCSYIYIYTSRLIWICCIHRKYSFLANLVPKFNIVCSEWSWVPRLIRISRIQWFCSLFLFLTGKTFLVPKIWYLD